MSADEHVTRIFHPARKFIVQRARRTKKFLQNCVPNSWTAKTIQRKISQDQETQTSPVIKRHDFLDYSKSNHSKNTSGDSATYNRTVVINVSQHDPPNSCHSVDSFIGQGKVSQEEFFDEVHWSPLEMKTGSCPCIHHNTCTDDSSTCSVKGISLFEKLTELQHEIHMIHSTLSSLQSSSISSIPPPPPLPPVPLLHYQNSLNPVSQSVQPLLRRHESFLMASNGMLSEDDGKPLITLEELQKVKLRKISSFSNNGALPY